MERGYRGRTGVVKGKTRSQKIMTGGVGLMTPLVPLPPAFCPEQVDLMHRFPVWVLSPNGWFCIIIIIMFDMQRMGIESDLSVSPRPMQALRGSPVEALL